MSESPLPPDSELLTTIAAWVTGTAGSATVSLFLGTMLLRFATVRRSRRRKSVIAAWRGVFAAAMLSRDEADRCALPEHRPWAVTYLLEEWNRIAGSVAGDSAHNLVTLANRLGLQHMARKRLRGHDVHDRLLAIRTLGLLGDRHEWDSLRSLVRHPNTALSATAALALVQIDAAAAMPEVMPAVIARMDWPPAPVYGILRAAGPGLVTQPLCHAILTSAPTTAVRLLRYADLAQIERIDDLIELVLRERTEPAVLAATVRAANGQVGVPRIGKLARHADWRVRVQAARLLGRIGNRRELPLLEELLADKEWWVRYRAAQSIARLPFVGPQELRLVRDRQQDRYAHDMMQQAMAEVGLA